VLLIFFFTVQSDFRSIPEVKLNKNKAMSAFQPSKPNLTDKIQTSKNKVSSLKEDYQLAIIDLASLIEKKGLDVHKLNQRASNMSKNDFLTSLPSDVRYGYEKFHKIIEKIQDKHLADEGKDRRFFKKIKQTTPAWVQKREQQLQNIILPLNLEQFVTEKAEDSKITDQDIEVVLDACHQNKDCIEKSIYTWLQSNHLLTKDQHGRIKEALVESL
jgi:hypothetical protein